MDIDEMRSLLGQLTALMKENKLTELEIEQDGLRVHLKKEDCKPARDSGGGVAAPLVQPTSNGAGADSGQPSPDTGLHTITSPMVGTLYRAASPDADSFVEIGDLVDEDTVVSVIEAMKVFNEIKAECEGKVVDILIGNGEAVEFGQPLFLIEPTK